MSAGSDDALPAMSIEEEEDRGGGGRWRPCRPDEDDEEARRTATGGAPVLWPWPWERDGRGITYYIYLSNPSRNICTVHNTVKK